MLLNLKKNEVEFISKNIENSENLLQTDKVNDILDSLSDWILENGFDENYDLTDEGRLAQRIYDNIYMNNEE